MDKLLERIVKIVGWKRALSIVWRAVKPSLEAAAKKTNTSIDDEVVKVLDEVLMDVINDQAA